MRVLVVTGIYPPDIGGPATHSDDVRRALSERGHDVTVVTLTDERRATWRGPVVRFPRSWAWPIRTAVALERVVREARRHDVVYATGLGPVAVAGAGLAHRPVALKIVGDPAWERGVRRGLTASSFDEFQNDRGGPLALRGMRAVRDWSVRHATVVLSPSRHLADRVATWSRRNDVRVVPNGVRTTLRPAPADADADVQLVFVGRLVAHKHLEKIIEAVARSERSRLDVVGEGPEETTWRALTETLDVAEQVRFHGALGRDDTLARIANADALVLASGYEGLPHVVLEALACGTPVVTTPHHGLDEVLTDGVDALLVADEPAALGAAFDRLAADDALLRRLQVGASESGRRWTLDHCVDQLEALFGELTAPPPRAVFLGKTDMPAPPTPDDERKYAINGRHVTSYVVCTGRPGGLRRPAGAHALALPRLRCAPVGSAVFYGAGPLLALRAAAGRPPSAVVCQSPFEAFGVALLRGAIPPSRRPRLQIEVHGDWRTATRLYGGSRRRMLGPTADRVAEWTLRRADRVRVVSDYLAGLVHDAGYAGPVDQFIAYSDYEEFLRVAPVEPPTTPRAVFIGVLERYKAVDVLLDAWRTVVERMPDARLTMIGRGSLHDDVATSIATNGLARSVDLRAPMPRADLRREIDASSCLVLPSRSEGLGRVVLEAMGRERPVVASAVGGIIELVEPGRTGLLVPPDDALALADALTEVLGARERARAMGREAGRRARARRPLDEYEQGIARLAAWMTAS
jgi:glycosyltransferase involved in cell wall biosynthesis